MAGRSVPPAGAAHARAARFSIISQHSRWWINDGGSGNSDRPDRCCRVGVIKAPAAANARRDGSVAAADSPFRAAGRKFSHVPPGLPRPLLSLLETACQSLSSCLDTFDGTSRAVVQQAFTRLRPRSHRPQRPPGQPVLGQVARAGALPSVRPEQTLGLGRPAVVAATPGS